ncbi:hypothetical protein K439DRAFT_137300 [Ramaria rubella]|nr:hypothetical protein K439DRAFT_137300 [Ramaria rubella]
MRPSTKFSRTFQKSTLLSLGATTIHQMYPMRMFAQTLCDHSRRHAAHFGKFSFPYCNVLTCIRAKVRAYGSNKSLGFWRLRAKGWRDRTIRSWQAMFGESCHVVLTRCAKSTTIPAFARCLALLPNLRTIEILHAHSQMTTAFKNSFEGISLPSIHTAILSSCAHNILRCCPEVRYVTCTEENGSKLVSAIAQCCPKVEGLHGIIPDVALMKSQSFITYKKNLISI